MRPENNDTGNVIEGQARDSAKRDLQGSSGDDAPENRQELVAVLDMMDIACIRRALFIRHQAVASATAGCSTAKAELLGYIEHAMAAIETAQPPLLPKSREPVDL